MKRPAFLASPWWRGLLLGIALTLAAAVLGLIFVSYQMPELLLELSNINYCG